MEYRIRYPKQSDWKKLWVYINTLSNERTYISYQGEKISQQEEKMFVSSSIKSMAEGKSIQLIVEYDQQIIGSASLNCKPRAESHVGVIGISLLKPYRNQGIGKRLLQQLLSDALDRLPQLVIAELYVMANNPRAIHVYESIGFKECGRIPQGIRHQEKLIDNILMIKEMARP